MGEAWLVPEAILGCLLFTFFRKETENYKLGLGDSKFSLQAMFKTQFVVLYFCFILSLL